MEYQEHAREYVFRLAKTIVVLYVLFGRSNDRDKRSENWKFRKKIYATSGQTKFTIWKWKLSSSDKLSSETSRFFDYLPIVIKMII